ncbi:hypothetical protein HK405_000089 [Cladochytrium tenue]|nr:hypothetical protein HK405_000089 [Cladochytrium tenue]
MDLLLEMFPALSDQIDPAFRVDDKDVVLRKIRLYAGAGNALEQILQTHKIDTVVLSGMSLSAVVMATVYRLIDLDYNVVVIADNVLELPGDDQAAEVKHVLLALLRRIGVQIVSLEEAVHMLGKS